MQLSDKLASILADDVLGEFNQLLNQSQVSISWWGQRLVSVEGYEGAVEINELAAKYLSAAPFHQADCTLQHRLECYALWDRVKQLYQQSDEKLTHDWFYKKIFNYLQEFNTDCRVCDNDPMAVICEWQICQKEIDAHASFKNLRNRLITFQPEELKQMGPNTKSQFKDTERVVASQEMIREAIKFQEEYEFV
jgi:hypothetical protein